jgi:drug/metabolite transporter (DMT)-like permease
VFYISVFPTAIGFMLYLKLVKNVGPDKGGYVFVLVPVVSLLISKTVENYIFDIFNLIGLIFILSAQIMIYGRNSNYLKSIVILLKRFIVYKKKAKKSGAIG